MGLAAVTLDTQPVLPNSREMGAARNEGDVRPGLDERGTIGPAMPPVPITAMRIPSSFRPGYRRGRISSELAEPHCVDDEARISALG